jgi:hypothetical protein
MDGLFFLFALCAVGIVIVWTVIHGAASGMGDSAPEVAPAKQKSPRPGGPRRRL